MTLHRRIALFAAAIVAATVFACAINPQPIPPADMASGPTQDAGARTGAQAPTSTGAHESDSGAVDVGSGGSNGTNTKDSDGSAPDAAADSEAGPPARDAAVDGATDGGP